MPIANTYFDHFARYGYTLIVKLDNCRTNLERALTLIIITYQIVCLHYKVASVFLWGFI